MRACSKQHAHAASEAGAKRRIFGSNSIQSILKIDLYHDAGVRRRGAPSAMRHSKIELVLMKCQMALNERKVDSRKYRNVLQQKATYRVNIIYFAIQGGSQWSLIITDFQ